MILAALNDYYRRLSAAGGDDVPPPFGFAIQRVGGMVRLDADGRFLGLSPLTVLDDKGKERPRPVMVPQPPVRTSGVAAAFLCDSGGYLLGRDLKGKPERVRQQFEASAALHRDLLADVDSVAARAIRAHFATWRPEEAGPEIDEELLAAFLVFWVDGRFAHEDPAILDAWRRHAAANRSPRRGTCMVTGENDVPLARLHPLIKGAGGQSSGTSLVSFNFDAAVSYGGGQEYSVPVSEEAAFGYGAALNHLLRRETGRARKIGDMTVVVWAEKPCAAEGLLADLFTGMTAADDAPPEDVKRARQVRDALERIAQGDVPAELAEDGGTRFYVLGLSPNAARLTVRLWLVSTLGDLVERVRQHQDDLHLACRDLPRRFPTLWSLVDATRAKDKDGRSRVSNDQDKRYKLLADLMRAAVTGSPYPAALLPELLSRLRADGHVTHSRIALLKAVAKRLYGGILPVDHDASFDSQGYRLGTLFAILESLQRAAHGRDPNAGVADKYVSAFSATPAALFGHLLGNAKTHMKKLGRDRKGLAVWFDSQIGECVVGIGTLPATLPPQEQANFYLGYYQWKNRKRPETVDDADETN